MADVALVLELFMLVFPDPEPPPPCFPEPEPDPAPVAPPLPPPGGWFPLLPVVPLAGELWLGVLITGLLA